MAEVTRAKDTVWEGRLRNRKGLRNGTQISKPYFSIPTKPTGAKKCRHNKSTGSLTTPRKESDRQCSTKSYRRSCSVYKNATRVNTVQQKKVPHTAKPQAAGRQNNRAKKRIRRVSKRNGNCQTSCSLKGNSRTNIELCEQSNDYGWGDHLIQSYERVIR